MLVLLLVLSYGFFIPKDSAQAAAPASWLKGVSIQSHWNGDFASASFKQSVNNAAGDNVNYIALVFNYYQSNLYSTDIQPGGDTPTDAALTSAIDYIHSKGLAVMLKPHLESYTGEWRAYINPSDRTSWFTNYGNMLDHYAQMAAAHNVEAFCIGAELIDMSTSSANSTNTQNWINLINGVRGYYSGQLTYSGNWGPSGFVDEKNNIQFWSSLDFIGISAYYNLNSDNSVSNLENAWAGYNSSDIQPLAQRWNKPVVFTETGYLSVSGSHYQPWNAGFSGAVDQTEQANDYQALFDHWSGQSFMHGMMLWDWSSNPNAGGSGDGGYTPQGKQAEQVMKTAFAGGNITPPPTTGTPNFSVSSTYSQSVISTTVTNNGQASSGDIVDVEVYNPNGQRTLQKYYDNQNFAAGQSQTYQTSFTPPDSQTYTVKVGVFNYSWSTLYTWNNNAGQISGSGSTTPPPTNSGIVYVNGYPTVNGNYIDCDGSVDNDMAHHSTDLNDTDPGHHLGQNCPAGSYVATH